MHTTHPAQPPVTDLPHQPLPEKPQSSGLVSLLSTIGVLIAAPLLAILLTVFVFRPYEVDGPSMQHTLENKDRLLVLKLPRTWANITKTTYLPKRNDIVVFNRTSESAQSTEKQLIKRVIGLPGDRVVVDGGNITVYNEANSSGFNPDETIPETANNKQTPGEVDITVNDGEIFVVGDNRLNSLDSRNFGTIPASDIVGVLSLRIWPIDKFKSY